MAKRISVLDFFSPEVRKFGLMIVLLDLKPLIETDFSAYQEKVIC